MPLALVNQPTAKAVRETSVATDANRMTITLCNYLDIQMSDGVPPIAAVMALETALRHLETLYIIKRVL